MRIGLSLIGAKQQTPPAHPLRTEPLSVSPVTHLPTKMWMAVVELADERNELAPCLPNTGTSHFGVVCSDAIHGIACIPVRLHHVSDEPLPWWTKRAEMGVRHIPLADQTVAPVCVRRICGTRLPRQYLGFLLTTAFPPLGPSRNSESTSSDIDCGPCFRCPIPPLSERLLQRVDLVPCVSLNGCSTNGSSSKSVRDWLINAVILLKSLQHVLLQPPSNRTTSLAVGLG